MSKKSTPYEIIPDRILEALRAGLIPWERPWDSEVGEHRSIRGHFYRGINPMLLQSTAMLNGYTRPVWLTFRNARQLGGSVKKGEKGTPVVFWKWIKRTREDEVTGEKKLEKFPILRYYTVFNVDQCENVEVPESVLAPPEPSEFSPIESAEKIVADWFAREGAPSWKETRENRCYYSPQLDAIRVVRRERFTPPEAFYSTLFHEMGHATGHASRLSRPGITDLTLFGDHEYSREELVAEMTAAFLCARAGVENVKTTENTVAYIQSWISTLKADSRAVVIAAAQAQKAADHVLGVSHEIEVEEKEAA